VFGNGYAGYGATSEIGSGSGSAGSDEEED
jgi:hypothetical protein